MRQTLIEIEGFLYRQELITEQQVSSAWMTAAWYRAKRLPTLKSVLGKIGKRRKPDEKSAEKRKQDFDQMAAEMTKDLNIEPQE